MKKREEKKRKITNENLSIFIYLSDLYASDFGRYDA